MAKIFPKVSSRSSRRGPQRSLSTVLYVGIIVVVCILVVLWRTSVTSFFWRITTPLFQIRDSISATQNEELRAALASADAEIADRNFLYQENLSLKSLLGRSDVKTKTILAGVLLRPPAIPYDTFIVDAGSAQGVAQNDLVSAGGTTVIGVVETVYATTARIKLFSASGSTYDAVLLLPGAATSSPETSVPITVEGQGAGSLSAQVPANTPVALNDTVVLPGIATGFFGAVSAINSGNGESFITLYLHLPLDLFSVRYVEIWKQSNATE